MGALASCRVAADPEAGGVVGALQQLLDSLLELLIALPPTAYTSRPSAASGPIGAHVRHALDHVATLAGAASATEICYDRRARGTGIESDPAAAVREVMRLRAALDRWARLPLEHAVAVRAQLSASGDEVVGWSSRARELAFVVQHTIHHQAIIALLLEMQGVAPPGGRFGYAPTTPRG